MYNFEKNMKICKNFQKKNMGNHENIRKIYQKSKNRKINENQKLIKKRRG